MAGPGDLPDDLPPLVGEDGQEVPEDLPPLVHDGDQEAAPPPLVSAATVPKGSEPDLPRADADELTHEAFNARRPEGVSEEDGVKATVALQAAAALQAAKAADDSEEAAPVSAEDAIKQAMSQAEEPKQPTLQQVDDKTMRMIQAIAKDDFEECEDAILQGADVNVDCGAGMHALHVSALRGEMFLTELLIAHGAKVNQRDLSGNTPLLYACHFYRQHQRGVQLVSQLLFHKADPHYRVKDGKMAGRSAHDIMDKACNEPNTDENVPRQMRAMLQLAMDGEESGYEAITKVWMSYKSMNKKLYQVSSKKDSYDYVMKNIDWVTPANAKNKQATAPVKLEGSSDAINEERFTYLKDYLFTDEGEKVKVYVNFPEEAAEALKDASAVEVGFEYQAFDLKLRSPSESFRLRIDPVYGSIDVDQCKHRVSAASKKVTLTLVKRHKNRIWPAIQKPR
mmetsp:Transcript_50021/g.149381  ORF Transcript_50021/g.149381 Transcript_50021/m.149381 type:complete len:452 (-) Transcript_50021:99-1454(-)